MSPVEQDTLDYEYLGYFESKKIKKYIILKRYTYNLCNAFFNGDATIFKKIATENMKKLPSKVSHNCFWVLPSGPKPATL